jgi:hypothetical protein
MRGSCSRCAGGTPCGILIGCRPSRFIFAISARPWQPPGRKHLRACRESASARETSSPRGQAPSPVTRRSMLPQTPLSAPPTASALWTAASTPSTPTSSASRWNGDFRPSWPPSTVENCRSGALSVPDTANAYLALRAALRAVLAHNAAGHRPIRRVLCPGLATTTGRMPVARCAAQMRAAWDNVLGDGPPKRITWRAVADLQQRLLAEAHRNGQETPICA